jgi:phosphoserine phosphatase
MNVLPEDKEMALKLYKCCYLYLGQAQTELSFYNFDEADRWVKEYERCKRELDELIRKKEEHDKLLQIVEMMKEKGIDIAIVTRGNE